MNCRQCRINGDIKEGGEVGACWRHIKTKCRMCGRRTGGPQRCAKCEHDADIQRWKAEAYLKVWDGEDHEAYIQLRKEKLLGAKFHCHRAVEVFFRGLALAVEGLWGDMKVEEPKVKKQPQRRKAA